MRTVLILAAFAVLTGGTVWAQGWKEYAYQRDGFAAQYPAEPRLDMHAYETAHGTRVAERTYTVNSGGVLYVVAIADFGRAPADERDVIDEAADRLIGTGMLTHDVSARLNWNYGREIRVVDAQGTSHTDAIFFIGNKLYQIKVVYPAINTDPAGSSGIHFFQQAFRLLP